MPKRSAKEKLAYYEKKIRKLQEKNRRLISSDSSECENIEENSNVDPSIDISGSLEPVIEIPENQTQLARPQSPAPLPTVEVTPESASGPSIEEETELPLDPDLLSALGVALSDTPDFGDSIHSSLAKLWTPILQKGLSKEERERITKEHLIPSNCKLLQAPKLNAEISAAVSEIVRGRDKKLVNFQQELGVGVSAINRGMDLLLKTENKNLALKSLSDGCRLLSDLHYCFTKDRTKLILPSLDRNILHIIQDTERDETLFGNSLGERIKASKAIEKQGIQIRNKTNSKVVASQVTVNRPVLQGNWNGPPRYTLNRGGRGGRGRAAPAVSRRHYPTTTAQTTSKSSNQSKPRVNAQQ